MLNKWLDLITLGAALGSGLMAGIFFSFSTSIMSALGRLPAPFGITTMQAINLVIVNPVFLLVFLGTAVASLVLAVVAVLNWQTSSALYLLGGSVLYLVGSLGITAAINVPKNNALATVAPDDPASAKFWGNYLVTWTNWNHVRTIATIAATLLLILALIS